MQSDARSIISLWFYTFLTTLVGLLLAAPFFLADFPIATPGAAKEFALYNAFAELLERGEYLPRWIPQAHGGLGSPVFYFEAPLGFYATWVISRLARLSGEFGPSVSFSLSFAAALLLSVFSAYYWLFRLGGPKIAFYGAVLYGLMPGHLSVAVLEQGNLGDAWAYVWLPAALRTIDSAARGSRASALYGAVIWGLLFLSNPVIALAFIPVALAYALIAPGYVRRERQTVKQTIGTLGYTAVSVLFGTGLAAFYLAPAVEGSKDVAMALPLYASRFRSEYLFADLAEATALRRYLDATVLAGIAFAVCFYFSLTEESERKTRRFVFFWMLASLYSAFLMTEAADSAWTALGTLPLLQHPGDAAAIIALSLAALAPAAAGARKGEEGKIKRFLLGSSASLILVAWIIAPAKLYQVAREQPASTKAELRAEAELLEFPEYLPLYAVNSIAATTGGDADSLLSTRSEGTVEVLRLSSRKIDFRATMPVAGSVALGQLYYPHWAASIQDEQQRLRLNPSTDGGIVEVAVPEGVNNIRIELLRTPGESAGNAVSAVSLGLVLMLAILNMLYPPVPSEEEYEDRIDEDIDAHLEEPIDVRLGRG